MIGSTETMRICAKGHKYYKSSDCPTCPQCEAARAPAAGFLSTIVAPARRALEREGISTLPELSRYSEKEILQLHGMGPSTLPKLRNALREARLTFRKK
jgi:hypothetical protein